MDALEKEFQCFVKVRGLNWPATIDSLGHLLGQPDSSGNFRWYCKFFFVSAGFCDLRFVKVDCFLQVVALVNLRNLPCRVAGRFLVARDPCGSEFLDYAEKVQLFAIPIHVMPPIRAMKGYDTWKFNSFDFSQSDPFKEVVGGEYGPFAWQHFCQTHSRGGVDGYVWEACRKGPFTTPISKFVFWLKFIHAMFCGFSDPLRVAGLNSGRWIDQAYLDACYTVEHSWVGEFFDCSVDCFQDDDCAINLRLRESPCTPELNDL